VPYVLIASHRWLRASYVGVDSYTIGELGTEHLIARGCRRIAHLRDPEVGIAAERHWQASSERWRGVASVRIRSMSCRAAIAMTLV
jgi:DNA-binding LacI/PurR family transcriptional regulator